MVSVGGLHLLPFLCTRFWKANNHPWIMRFFETRSHGILWNWISPINNWIPYFISNKLVPTGGSYLLKTTSTPLMICSRAWEISFMRTMYGNAPLISLPMRPLRIRIIACINTHGQTCLICIPSMLTLTPIGSFPSCKSSLVTFWSQLKIANGMELYGGPTISWGLWWWTYLIRRWLHEMHLQTSLISTRHG